MPTAQPTGENPTLQTWMHEARMLAAQCWCDKETEHRVMDPALAEAVARRIAAWMDESARYARNADYFRGIIDRIGAKLGPAAYTSDDGTVNDTVLCIKVPELVEALIDGQKEIGRFLLIERSGHRISIDERQGFYRVICNGSVHASFNGAAMTELAALRAAIELATKLETAALQP